MQNVKLVATPNHTARTVYNQQMWAALLAVPSIKTGVTIAALHAALIAAVPNQSVGHCTAHIRYLLRQKAALQYVAVKK
tara:strand:- start:178 stop:414 length:237 start_codon:yes stop_codon:yes gene_type:complete